MATEIGGSSIRGIDVNRILKGFSDEIFFFKNLVSFMKVSAEELRWYQKTAGVLSSTDTTGITAQQIRGVGRLTSSSVATKTYTRKTSYTQQYLFESEPISIQDIEGGDINVLMDHLREIARAVVKERNDRIYNVMTEDQSAVDILSTASTAAWDAASGVKIITDINTGIRKIREQNYEPTHLFLNPYDFASAMNELVET
mgnify:CR=1 FL=1